MRGAGARACPRIYAGRRAAKGERSRPAGPGERSAAARRAAASASARSAAARRAVAPEGSAAAPGGSEGVQSSADRASAAAPTTRRQKPVSFTSQAGQDRYGREKGRRSQCLATPSLRRKAVSTLRHHIACETRTGLSASVKNQSSRLSAGAVDRAGQGQCRRTLSHH